jgi:hypothetical protein
MRFSAGKRKSADTLAGGEQRGEHLLEGGEDVGPDLLSFAVPPSD